MTLSLRSPAFPPPGEIPKEYTCDGQDVSPSLERAMKAHILAKAELVGTYQGGK